MKTRQRKKIRLEKEYPKNQRSRKSAPKKDRDIF